MAAIKALTLSAEEVAALEKGYRTGPSHAYRTRCQMILLKSEGRSAAAVARIIGCCTVVIHGWVTRYRLQGIAGLQTRAGRGRKPILEGPQAEALVREAVQQSRQRLSLAKAELEEELGRPFCQRTLTRFVKKTVGAINASENVPQKSQTRSSTNSKSRD